MGSDPLLDIIVFTAKTARNAWEPIWPVWKAVSGYPGPLFPSSQDACIPTAFALRDVLRTMVPEYRWKAVGGRPTKRTPSGGYRAPNRKLGSHLWVEGRRGRERVVVDVTADQFGGPAVIIDKEGQQHTANASRKLLNRYEAIEKETSILLYEAFDAAMIASSRRRVSA